MATKKVKPDPRTCEVCEFYKPVNPGDDAGYCYRYPPIWIITEADATWGRPVVEPKETCGEFKQRLNS